MTMNKGNSEKGDGGKASREADKDDAKAIGGGNATKNQAPEKGKGIAPGKGTSDLYKFPLKGQYTL